MGTCAGQQIPIQAGGSCIQVTSASASGAPGCLPPTLPAQHDEQPTAGGQMGGRQPVAGARATQLQLPCATCFPKRCHRGRRRRKRRSCWMPGRAELYLGQLHYPEWEGAGPSSTWSAAGATAGWIQRVFGTCPQAGSSHLVGLISPAGCILPSPHVELNVQLQ